MNDAMQFLFNRPKLAWYFTGMLLLMAFTFLSFCTVNEHTIIKWRHESIEIGKYGAMMIVAVGYGLILMFSYIVIKLILFIYRKKAISITDFGLTDYTRLSPIVIQWKSIVSVRCFISNSGSKKSKYPFIVITIKQNNHPSSIQEHKISCLSIEISCKDIVDQINRYMADKGCEVCGDTV